MGFLIKQDVLNRRLTQHDGGVKETFRIQCLFERQAQVSDIIYLTIPFCRIIMDILAFIFN